MTTNSKIIQRTTPITHPAIIPTDDPSSSLLLCAPAVSVIVLDIDAIILLVDTNVAVAVVVSLVDVIEVVGLAVVVSLVDVTEVGGGAIVVSLVDVTEVGGGAIVVSLVDVIEVGGVAVAVSLVVTKVVRLTKGQNKCIYIQAKNKFTVIKGLKKKKHGKTHCLRHKMSLCYQGCFTIIFQ